ncbi:unnamed protein product [Toxocara canis]|uniref:BLM10_mid domain-containing protein n=1 Tax=Toxocara canis TaxID=6265 RepID=A0A183USK7_TOXCA|nr:unnamed protein product [Toxocara canis]
MNLPLRGGSTTNSEGAAAAQKTAAKWIIWMLGGADNSAETHLLRMIRCLESFLHPLQEGEHSPTLRTFLFKLVQEMAHRIRIERVCKKTRNHVPMDMRLTDYNIETFVTAVLPPALFSVYSTGENTEIYQTIRYLSFIAPQLVLPKVLDLVYPSLSTLTAPHRLSQSLECLVACCVPLVRDDGGIEYENFVNCTKDWIKEMRQNAEQLGQISCATPMPFRWRRRAKKVSDDDVVRGKRRQPLRCHVIVLLEAMVNAIDINDVDKTSLAFTVLTRLMTLIPIVDCSRALSMEKYKGLSREEKELCRLTSRLPRIVNLFITRIFALITELSASPPKSSSACLGSICELGTEAAEGADETRLKKDIQSAVNAVLKNCSTDIVETVARRTFLFVSTSEFENRLAVELTCALISECIYANPVKYLPMFLNHVTNGLNQLITEETLQMVVLDPSAMWYVMLGSTLFYVPARFIIQNTEQFTQLHKQLLSFKCRIAYEIGCASLNTALSQLTEIYTETEGERRVCFNGSLEEELPIARWGVSVDKNTVKMGWHIPQPDELQLAESFIYDVVETELERLEAPHSLDKDEVRKSLYIISSVLTANMNRIPPLKGSVIDLFHSRVPLNAVSYTNSVKGLRQFSFYGECIRSLVFDRLHALLDYLLATREHECRNLNSISSIMALLAVPESNNSLCLATLEKRVQSMVNWYGDPIRGFRASIFDVVEMRINYAHLSRLNKPSSIQFTASHLNIIRDLARLGTSLYAEVRESSQNDLIAVVTAFPACRSLFAADIVKPLDVNESGVTHEQLKVAWCVLHFVQLWFLDYVKCRCTCRHVASRRQNAPFGQTFDYEFSQNLVQLSKCFWDNKSRYALKPFWEPLADTDQTAAKAKALRQCNERRRKIEKIRDELIDVCNNVGKTLHWRNVDSSSFMLVTLFRMNYDPKAIQVFLQMFHEERPSWRDIGATTVFGWLKWNKPPSVRSFWKPPAKVEEKAAPYACGMRPDNVCLAYDLNSLPSTKKLWDETVFITKPHWGTFQWPRTLKTFAPYDKQIHLSRPFDKLTPIEKTVVNTLGEIGFLQRWHLTLLREKEDSEPFSIYTFNVVKHPPVNESADLCAFSAVEPSIACLRGQQRLGAEYVFGLIRGSKNWPFEKLKRMWKWLRPLMSTAIEGMLTDASASWVRGITLATRDIDMRQVHWLVELIMELASKPAPTSWHSCFRLKLMQVVTTSAGWRTSEPMNRAIAIVTARLPFALLETERSYIASRAMVSGICTASWTAPVGGGPVLEENIIFTHLHQLLILRVHYVFRSLAYAAIFSTAYGDQKLIPEQYRLPSIAGVISVFQEELEEILRDIKMHKSYEHHKQIVTLFRSLFASPSSENLHAAEAAETTKKNIYVKSLLLFLKAYYLLGFTAFPPSIMSLYTLLAHLADEEKSRADGDGRQIELQADAAHVFHQVWATAYLCEGTIDEMISKTREAQWEVKTAHSDLAIRHGAVLGLSAVLRAYPFTIPPFIPDAILTFCKNGASRDAVIRVIPRKTFQETVTDTLRSFLHTHRDNWKELCANELSEVHANAIHNVVSPNYYV